MRFALATLAAILPALAGAAAQDWYPENPDPLTGYFSGDLVHADGSREPLYVQVIALPEQMYQARVLRAPEQQARATALLRKERQGAALTFDPALGADANTVVKVTDEGVLVAGTLWQMTSSGGDVTGAAAGLLNGKFDLKPYAPHSPTLGKAPAQGAVVLLGAGQGLSRFQAQDGSEPKWEILDGGIVQVPTTFVGSIMSKEKFGDCHIHLEFRCPWKPWNDGQERGNSGVYLEGRYEIQVLDSFGENPRDDYCGGIYQIAPPRVNASLPATLWQTYDIDFTAPRFDAAGNKTTNARITVRQNGILIHDDQELPHETGGPISPDEAATGPLLLQDHGNPVQYRNVWVVRM